MVLALTLFFLFACGGGSNVCSASSLCACDAACGGAIRGYRNPARERGAGAARAPNPTPRSPGDQGGKHSARAHPLLAQIYDQRSLLQKKSQWLVGGQG